ncbi:MAG: ATP-binding protein [Dehalococcoidales bacterium]|nr:ATP-binding protein [Dehalococcoidales bacterium]
MIKELKAEQVRLKCDPMMFKCASTTDLDPYEGIIGQDRALSALKFGLNIQRAGFNIFVSGLAGTGKTTVIKSFLDALAAKKETPPDWCYVYNFKDADRPNALKIPAGTGQSLQKDMKHTIDNVKRTLVQTFASKEYGNHRSELVDALNKKRETVFNTLSLKAKEKGLLLKASQVGLMLIPASSDQPMSEEAFQKLNPADKDVLIKNREELMKELKDHIAELQVEENNVEKQLEENDHQVVGFTIGHIFDEMKNKYRKLTPVVDYLGEVEQNIIENFEQFKVEPKNHSSADPWTAMQEMSKKQSLTKYEVNVLVDNSGLKGAPVILELNPTFNNLLGRIEKDAQFGALFTDYTMIKSGSLHRANGGFLVMRIEDLLSGFQTWEGLKRTLRDGNLVIEDIGERLGYIATKSLRPEPVPLDIKVVIIGEPMYYYLLLHYDREFSELFKVKADFDSQMDRTEKNLKDYAAVICRICGEEKLKHLKSDALAKIIEYSSRLAENQEKLSTLFADIADIIREANFWADENKARLIEAKHIQKAIEQKVYRSNLIQQHINEMINKNTIMIDTNGEAIGQVNGLAVIDLGDFAFGRPSRITASLGLGREGVMDIEREARLGGRLHTKGVMILNGYITEKYARDIPLSLSARLAFEQSYDEVDGDSASSTELYALLSRLAEAPTKQGFAVTGSVNQKGEVQAIGGVNEKIEGFFEVCRANGLTGEQGVIIPASNIKHLMLKEDVVAAIGKGKFHIYPVSTIDEGIEILTGIKAGKRLKSGAFQADSINDRVQKRLLLMAEKLRDFGKPDEKSERKNKNHNDSEAEESKPKKYDAML